ncbi:MAG: segregation/condensation protein A, partial [Bacilli bacterium]|nr:segregation/condensation protein A [Bacilli bacterium]
MEYKVTIDNFDGPLDLLLHLIKKTDIDIWNINIVDITEQYLNYINEMETLNLNIASEYIVMAAELMEIKSSMLLPKPQIEEDEFFEDPKEQLINRLLMYKKYKLITTNLKELEEERAKAFSKDISDLSSFLKEKPKLNEEVNIDDLVAAFNDMLERKKQDAPLATKITTKGYSVDVRSNEIKDVLKIKKQVLLDELFDVMEKEYIVVTFLSILDLAKKQVINLKQDCNFKSIS